MKAKTSREIEVSNLSKTLKPLSPAAIKWAKQTCFEHLAITTKSNKWCTDCGHSWIDKQQTGKCKCPKCGTTLEINASQIRTKNFGGNYFTLIHSLKEYQIVNTYYINKISKKNSQTQYDIENVIQIWTAPNGKETILAKNYAMGYYNNFNLFSELSIKKERNYSYTNYRIYGDVYPKKTFSEELMKRGCIYNNKLNCNPSFLFKYVLSKEPFYETLLKTKQYSLLNIFVNTSKLNDTLKKAINICNRNNYIVEDATMWIDYIELLSYFNMDIHNAKYVCPKNLFESHDILLRRKIKKEEKERQHRILVEKIQHLKNRKDAILNFYKQKNKFFGINITTDDFNIVPLESITQFYLEGKSMKHCVFEMEYFKKQDSLILSARNKEGKPIETIELSLSNWTIIQSRAVCNGISPLHKEIQLAIKKNIAVFKHRLTA